MSVDKITRLKIYVTIGILSIVACLFVVMFIYSLMGAGAKNNNSNSEDYKTKVFGLLNGETEKSEVITREDREEEKASLPVLSKQMQEQIQITTSHYLMTGEFESLDAYLKEVESKYRDKENKTNAFTMKDASRMRGELATIVNMNSKNAPSLMQSFKNPDFLMAALVHKPISCKYISVSHLDSLMVTPPSKYTPVTWERQNLQIENESAILHQVNEVLNLICDKVAVYKSTLYGVEFEYILSHNLQTDCWTPCVIQTQDKRAYQIFDTAFDLQSKVKKGMLTEETLDSGLVYYDIDDMVKSNNQTETNQNTPTDKAQEYHTAKPIIDLTADEIEGMFDDVDSMENYSSDESAP